MGSLPPQRNRGKANMAHTTTLLLLLLFSSAILSSAVVPLHDILGHNITTANLYYIRNYTIGSYSGAGAALYPRFRSRCASYVGLASSASNSGLEVKLVLPNTNDTIVWPGQRFKLVFAYPPPCWRGPEWALEDGPDVVHVVTSGGRSRESYFSVAVDEFGRYSLEFCGPCLLCKNACIQLGLSRQGLLKEPGASFNFFFQKKKASAELHQSM